MTSILCSGISIGACASSSSAPVSSGNEFPVAQAVFFPCPTNADTVSHPVSAWSIGRASDFADPRLLNIGDVFLIQMQSKLHCRLVVFQLPSQPTPQHQCQQYVPVYGDGHVMQHVLHAASFNCQPLRDCTGLVSVQPVVVVRKQPDSHL